MSYEAGSALLSPTGRSGGATPVGAPLQLRARPGAAGSGAGDAAGMAAPRLRSFGHWLQEGLNMAQEAHAFLDAPLAVDGIVGAQTKRAVRRFQAELPKVRAGEVALAPDGIVGPATTGALERVVGAKNPFGRPARDLAPAPEAAPEAAAEPEVPGGGASPAAATSAPAAAPGVSAPAAEVSAPGPGTARPEPVAAFEEAGAEQDGAIREAAATAEVQGQLGALAAKGRAQGLDPDVGAAYERTRQWTMERLANKDTDRAKAVYAKLSAAWEAARAKHAAWVAAGQPGSKRPPKDPKDLESYVRGKWFREYWFRKCYQFAAQLQRFLKGGGRGSLMAMVGEAIKANEAGEPTTEQKGRTTLYRGMTLAEMAESELKSPQLAPGTAVHVKICWEIDAPYTPKDDFHHWVIYAGDGKFSDTLSGQNKAGSAHDRTLAGWVESAFKHPDYKHLHDDPRYAAERRRNLPVPLSGLQPRITAEYDPRQAITKRTR